jgi:D-amino-acid dehydrogenase
MLMDPLGPLAIRWAYLPRIAPWLIRFVAASRRSRVEEIAAALRPLLAAAVEAYLPLLEAAGASDILRRTGWLTLYETDESFREAQYGMELQRRLGVVLEVLRAEEIRQAEPSLAPIYRHAVLSLENCPCARPLSAGAAAGGNSDPGGRNNRAACHHRFEFAAGRPVAARTAEGSVPFDAVVIAAGAWSRPLARAWGQDVPLDTERGYHITLPSPGVMPRRPIYSGDHSFAVTTAGNRPAPRRNGGAGRLEGAAELRTRREAADPRPAHVPRLGIERREPLDGLSSVDAGFIADDW